MQHSSSSSSSYAADTVPYTLSTSTFTVSSPFRTGPSACAFVHLPLQCVFVSKTLLGNGWIQPPNANPFGMRQISNVYKTLRFCYMHQSISHQPHFVRSITLIKAHLSPFLFYAILSPSLISFIFLLSVISLFYPRSISFHHSQNEERKKSEKSNSR